MVLFYIDESGTGIGKGQTPFFILTSIAIPATEWQAIDFEIAKLKRSLIHWTAPEDFEIKGRDLRQGQNLFDKWHWPERVKAFHEIAELIARINCRIFIVRVEKRHLPEHLSHEDMYRLAFWRLLEQTETVLESLDETGLLMLDARSDLHSNVSDRRLVNAYREWIRMRKEPTRLVELPWFGFSEFYAGLQLADFVAYLANVVAEERLTTEGQPHPGRASELTSAYSKFESKIWLLPIP